MTSKRESGVKGEALNSIQLLSGINEPQRNTYFCLCGLYRELSKIYGLEWCLSIAKNQLSQNYFPAWFELELAKGNLLKT